MTDVGITGGKKEITCFIYLEFKKKVLTDQMITKVVDEVEKKAAEFDNK